MFRVIAIELLEPEQELQDLLTRDYTSLKDEEKNRVDCYKSVVRILKPGQMYYFYQGYEIVNGIVRRVSSQLINDVLYMPVDDNSSMPTVSICSIVGENGAGKSSLVELMMRVINNLSYACGTVLSSNYRKSYPFVEEVFARIYFECSDSEEYGTITCMNHSLKASMGSFLVSGTLETNFCDFVDNHARYLLQKFCYSVIVDYSAYAFNPLDFYPEWNTTISNGKCWFDELFHKNDSYQLPIVVHPFREAGSVNYESERNLLIERMYNLVLGERPLLSLFNGKEVAGFSFETSNDSDYSKSSRKYVCVKLRHFLKPKDILSDKKIPALGKAIVNAWKTALGIRIDAICLDTLTTQALNYIVYKSVKIVFTYREYAKYKKLIINNHAKILDYVYELAMDRTHITAKLRRCITFILLRSESVSYKITNTSECTYNAADALVNIEDYKNYVKRASENIELVCAKLRNKYPAKNTTRQPVEFNWKENDFWPSPSHKSAALFVQEQTESQELVSYNTLSSGEKHIISIVSAILYHLHNLQTRHFSTRKKQIKYENVCIVCDEVELYAHPIYQVRLIDYILSAIQGLDWRGERTIKGIQIILATHSPFILSDIPSCNLLCLQDGKPQYNKLQKTFGANVYDLLSNQFFMDGFVGAFASKQIGDIIESYNQKDTKKKSKEDYMRMKCIANQVGDIYIQNTLKEMIAEMTRDL